MALEITREAADLLKESLTLAGIDLATGGARLRAARGLGGGSDVQVELAPGPAPGEEILERDGVRVFLDPTVAAVYPDAVLTVEPQHDTIVVRPR